MIPVIERELVAKKKWVEPTHFFHLITIAQAIPGIIALNSAIYLGYKLKGIKGALASGLGVIIPSFFIMLGVAFAYVEMGAFPAWLDRFFDGVKVAVIALIIVAALRLYTHTKNPYKLLIVGIIFAIMVLTQIHPFALILVVLLLTALFSPREKHA